MMIPKRNFATELGQTRPIKILINIGACLDIPTGRYVKGAHGEHILNGGLANLTGIFGMGNSFKSTAMHYMTLAAQSRMYGSFVGTYDTEMNIQEWRLSEMAENVQRFLRVPQDPIIDTGIWAVTDKSMYSGNKWYDKVRDLMKDRVKNKKEWEVTTPFLDRDGKPLKMAAAMISQVDSFSEINTDAVEKMQDDAEIGEAGQNAVSLKQGQHKNQMLMELPGLTVGSDTYMFLVAHFGDVYALDPRKPPQKKLGEISADKKIKGVPEKFTYVMHNCWWSRNTSTLINAGTKEPEFPRDEHDDRRGDTDLKTITLHQVRGKAGPTGIQITLVVSQNLGVLPSLTEFYNIKESDRFGIEGNLQNYYLTLLPSVRMTRKTVRGLLESDRKLARAVNITSELCQMHQYWFHMPEVMITPKELYEQVKARGYDWDMILDKTRGYWILEEDDRPQGLFLSTMDLINMANGSYHPYWLEKDCKTIKKQYLNQLPSEETQKEEPLLPGKAVEVQEDVPVVQAIGV